MANKEPRSPLLRRLAEKTTMDGENRRTELRLALIMSVAFAVGIILYFLYLALPGLFSSLFGFLKDLLSSLWAPP